MLFRSAERTVRQGWAAADHAAAADTIPATGHAARSQSHAPASHGLARGCRQASSGRSPTAATTRTAPASRAAIGAGEPGAAPAEARHGKTAAAAASISQDAKRRASIRSRTGIDDRTGHAGADGTADGMSPCGLLKTADAPAPAPAAAGRGSAGSPRHRSGCRSRPPPSTRSRRRRGCFRSRGSSRACCPCRGSAPPCP